MSDVERPQADIEKEMNGITFVTMPEQIIATVRTQGWMASAPSNAFWSLAGYIFGDNTASWKIAMTAPVTTTLVDEWQSQKIAMTAPVTTKATEDGLYETAFIMPSEWTMETLPVPNNKNVTLREVPSTKRAVWTFWWYATKGAVDAQWEKFQKALHDGSVDRSWSMTLAQYNDPWTPPWMRRNELRVEVE